MILAVDIGNTHIVIGCLEGMEIRNIARMKTDINRTVNEYAVTIKQILDIDNIDRSMLDGAVMCSVVPPLTDVVRSAVKILTGRDALVVGTGIKTGLNIMIDNPAQLGSDLVVGAVAAIHNYKPPLIIIDMGTATTMSVIDEKCNYRGAVIIPGLVLSLNALSAGTSQLPKISIEAPKNCIGTNTIDCMKSGGVFASASMLDGMIDRIEEELGAKTTVVATGGLAGQVVPYCKHSIIYDEDLLLTGLAIIYAKNQKNR